MNNLLHNNKVYYPVSINKINNTKMKDYRSLFLLALVTSMLATPQAANAIS